MGEVNLENIKILLQDQSEELKASIKDSLEAVSIQVHRNTKSIQKLENRFLLLERKIRRNNIVVFGLKVDESKVAEDTLQKLNSLLDLQLTINDINNIYKIGKSCNAPVVVEFVSFYKKLEIFRNKAKLKALKEVKVGIANDLCKHDRDNQKILRNKLKLCREKNIPARIKGYSLEIEGKLYSPRAMVGSDTSDSESEGSGNDSETEENIEKQNLVSEILIDRVKNIKESGGTTVEGVSGNHAGKRKVQSTLSPVTSGKRTRKKRRIKYF